MTLTKKEVKALRELVVFCDWRISETLYDAEFIGLGKLLRERTEICAKALKMKLPGRGE